MACGHARPSSSRAPTPLALIEPTIRELLASGTVGGKIRARRPYVEVEPAEGDMPEVGVRDGGGAGEEDGAIIDWGDDMASTIDPPPMLPADERRTLPRAPT